MQNYPVTSDWDEAERLVPEIYYGESTWNEEQSNTLILSNRETDPVQVSAKPSFLTEMFISFIFDMLAIF